MYNISSEFGAKVADSNFPRVILVCPTYRREDNKNNEAYIARHQGLKALYDQFLEQNYPKNKVELRIADSSEKGHEFFQTLRDPRVKYLHVPSRDDETREALSQTYPEAIPFLLSEQEMLSPHFRDRINYLHQYCSRRRDPQSAELIPSIPDPLTSPRPAIGMKRNMLCSLPFTADGGRNPPDIIISADDDDWRSPDYIQNTLNSLENADWTKLVNYHLAIYLSDQKEMHWGRKEFSLAPVEKDRHGLSSVVFSDRAVMFKSGEGFRYEDPEVAFTAPRWHPLSTDGAVHALRHDAWRRTVDLCGGYAPVSYNEDTLMFEALRMLGNLDNLKKIERDPRITGGLIGNKTINSSFIEADRKAGPARFNPISEDRFDFLRLCCANVSPVAFSEIVSPDEIPFQYKHVFDYLDGQTETAPQVPMHLTLVKG